MTQDEKFDSVGFRPLRRGQIVTGTEKEQQNQVSESPNPTFARRKTEQNLQQSIFPNWDLLPPRTIIRRKGQS